MPFTRSVYVRGLVGGVYYNRIDGILERGWGLSYGGEIGVTVLELEANSEFSRIALGVHFDHSDVSMEVQDISQNYILGQALFVRTTDWGTYFGPEAGIRQLISNDGGSFGSGLVVGIVAGVELPLTTHLSWGPQFEVLYAFEAPSGQTPAGTDGVDVAAMGKIHLAITYHF